MVKPRGEKSGGAFVSSVDLPRSEWDQLIYEWIFSERDRNILKRRLLDGLTYQDLADEFDMSIRQIKRITAKGAETLSKHTK